MYIHMSIQIFPSSGSLRPPTTLPTPPDTPHFIGLVPQSTGDCCNMLLRFHLT